MTRYWVIAPHHSEYPEIWDRVWQFDSDNSLISIGWKELDDISSYDENELKTAIERAFSTDSTGNKTRCFNMLWDFFHNIHTGDIIIARKGRKKIAAVGTVTRTAFYDHAKNAEASGKEHFHSYYIGVQWQETPKEKGFDRIVFGMQALYEISENLYRELVPESSATSNINLEDGVEDQTEFVLEKYLEDFIISNFDHIFKGNIVLYRDPEDNTIGQQYATDVGNIDILSKEPSTNSYVVIELKKGRESDKVVGQTLRYMGWISENLCKNGESVKGLIICRESDIRLSYALKTVTNITVKHYRVDFKLSDVPFKTA